MKEFDYAKFITWSEISYAVMPRLSKTPGIKPRGMGVWQDDSLQSQAWGVKCRLKPDGMKSYEALCDSINKGRPGKAYRVMNNDYVHMSPSTSTRWLCRLGLLDDRFEENPDHDVTYVVTELGVFFLHKLH